MSYSQILLGLGSNTERDIHLSLGLNMLADHLLNMRHSPVFESASVTGHGDAFLNLVVAAETSLSLRELVAWLKEIESIHGRRDGARPDRVTLDIDLLTFDDLVGKFCDVELPRAEMLERSYVLYPLSLIAPHAQHPRLKLSYEELWRRTPVGPQISPVALSCLTSKVQNVPQFKVALPG